MINLKVDDSEAEEAVDIPKFILAESSRGPIRSEDEPSLRSLEPKFNTKREKDGGPDEPWDASYSFGFTLEDQARHEVSDPDGNVKGYL